jgi:hypothetical protein
LLLQGYESEIRSRGKERETRSEAAGCVGNTLRSVVNAQHRIDCIDNNDIEQQLESYKYTF